MPSQRLMTLMTRRLRATSLARARARAALCEPAAPEAAPQTRSDGLTSRGSAWQTWRTLPTSVASVLLGSQLGALSPRATPSSSGGRGEREDEADLWELPPLSPAEKLVAAIFRPAAHMTL